MGHRREREMREASEGGGLERWARGEEELHLGGVAKAF